MKPQKIILLSILFLFIITGVRLTWNHIFADPEHPNAIAGQLDLSDWNFEDNKSIPIDGEWIFYPGILLSEGSADSEQNRNPSKNLIQVPGSWDAYFDNQPSPDFNYGTYHLNVQVSPKPQQSFSFRMMDISSASSVYVNGQLLQQSGQPHSDESLFIPRNVPYTATIQTDDDHLDIYIQVANRDAYDPGGIILPIRFGSTSSVLAESNFSIRMQFMFCIILIMHVVYAIILYFLGNRNPTMLYFALAVIGGTQLTLIADDKILLAAFPISHEWASKLGSLAIIEVAAGLLLYMQNVLTKARIPLFRTIIGICTLFGLIVIVSPTSYITIFSFLPIIIFCIPCIILPFVTFRATLDNEPNTIFLFIGSLSIATNIIWSIFKSFWITSFAFYPIDLLIAFLSFATYYFSTYIQNSNRLTKLSEQLMIESKRKDDFLANTSHEMRNPLHGILNIAQSMKDTSSITRPASDQRNLDLILQIGKRMSYLLNDLIDLNQLKVNRIQLQLSSVQLQSIASSVLDLLHYMTNGKPLRLVNNIPKHLPPVLADENRLIQILFNLLHNGVKFTEVGYVSITAELQHDSVLITIQDSGIGMDDTMLKRIFLPYEQLDSSISSIGGGIGLGLSITKELVELHNSQLQVQSTPGQGSTFNFTLPLSEMVQHTAVPDEYVEDSITSETLSASSVEDNNRPVLANDNRPHLLIVDDDSINLEIITNILTKERYDITTVTSARQALEMLTKKNWDLIISDVMMPRMSGYELTRTIRQSYSYIELPILLLTARIRAEDLTTGFEAGANDYVRKPVAAEEIRSRVHALTTMKAALEDRLKLEAAWLQAQIKPHFIFNTLNAISSLSEFDPPRMRLLIEQFSYYLRASFDSHNTSNLVPLQHELDLVKAYIYIEKERFEDRLNVQWDIVNSTNLYIPPLSIQTLVENAIRHGVLKQSQGGTVTIRILSEEQHTTITIIDDGIGMTQPTANQIAGIGLANTHNRLVQLYGSGLEITSSPGEGTEVQFKIPHLNKE